MTERTLPDYDEPPVIETVLGVQFAPLRGWGIPHYGLFWNEIKSEYPNFQMQDPVPADFGFSVGLQVSPSTAPTLQFSPAMPVRCWFFDPSRTRLIQLQNDRFMHNWIKRAGGQAYMHYEDVRPIFHQEWQRFVRFLQGQDIAAPGMLQCEVTYVNHIEQEKGWTNFGDLARVIAPWSGQGSTGFLPETDAVLINARYPIGDRASLNVVLEPAIRNSDGKHVIQLRLTASALVESNSPDEICRCLDLGRTWVVNGFTDFTTTEMHSLWKRRI